MPQNTTKQTRKFCKNIITLAAKFTRQTKGNENTKQTKHEKHSKKSYFLKVIVFFFPCCSLHSVAQNPPFRLTSTICPTSPLLSIFKTPLVFYYLIAFPTCIFTYLFPPPPPPPPPIFTYFLTYIYLTLFSYLYFHHTFLLVLLNCVGQIFKFANGTW